MTTSTGVASPPVVESIDVVPLPLPGMPAQPTSGLAIGAMICGIFYCYLKKIDGGRVVDA